MQGEHLYLDKHQYRVNIGVSLCEIVRTTSELIECKPPKHQPSTSQLDTGIYPELQVNKRTLLFQVVNYGTFTNP